MGNIECHQTEERNLIRLRMRSDLQSITFPDSYLLL